MLGGESITDSDVIGELLIETTFVGFSLRHIIGKECLDRFRQIRRETSGPPHEIAI